jgi:hypothetical protein
MIFSLQVCCFNSSRVLVLQEGITVVGRLQGALFGSISRGGRWPEAQPPCLFLPFSPPNGVATTF